MLKMQKKMKPPVYSLRIFKHLHAGRFTNTHVGFFKPLEQHGFHIFKLQEKHVDVSDATSFKLQIYPANEKKTMYELEAGKELFVYTVSKTHQIDLCGKIVDKDVYFYFSAEPSVLLSIILFETDKGNQEEEKDVINKIKELVG